MIPKIIHYCWFGHSEYPEKVKYCMKSWKTFMPDYKFVFWNEDNFDLNSVQFVRQAYDAKKYAFVSDYVRIYALKNYGGIYLDTDIEVVKSFDNILNSKAVFGTDESGYLTAFMAAEANHPYFIQLLDLYDNMNFLQKDGTMNTEVNNTWMQNILRSYGYQKKNVMQNLEQGIIIYPCEYFHAKSLTSGKLMDTENTYCIHHHTLLWVNTKTRIIKFVRMRIVVPILGAEKYTKLVERIQRKINGK